MNVFFKTWGLNAKAGDSVAETDTLTPSTDNHESDTTNGHSNLKNVTEVEENECDEEEAMLESFQRSRRNTRRCSLDSRMATLTPPVGILRTSSSHSLCGRAKTDDDVESFMETRPGKSISWADNLESVVEFENDDPQDVLFYKWCTRV